MKVLFITSRQIFPILGGAQIRTAQQLEMLSKRHDVDVVSIVDNISKVPDIHKYLPKVNSETYFRVDKRTHYRYALKFLLNNKPIQVNYYYHRELQRWIDDHINQYDAVFCNNIRTAEYVMKHKGVRKYMDFVDAISMNYERAKKIATGVKKLIYEIDFRRVRKYEQKCLKEFYRCSTISAVDRDYILNYHSGNEN